MFEAAAPDPKAAPDVPKRVVKPWAPPAGSGSPASGGSPVTGGSPGARSAAIASETKSEPKATPGKLNTAAMFGGMKPQMPGMAPPVKKPETQAAQKEDPSPTPASAAADSAPASSKPSDGASPKPGKLNAAAFLGGGIPMPGQAPPSFRRTIAGSAPSNESDTNDVGTLSRAGSEPKEPGKLSGAQMNLGGGSPLGGGAGGKSPAKFGGMAMPGFNPLAMMPGAGPPKPKAKEAEDVDVAPQLEHLTECRPKMPANRRAPTKLLHREGDDDSDIASEQLSSVGSAAFASVDSTAVQAGETPQPEVAAE